MSLRVIGLTAIAVVLIAAMTVMGLWQLGVYDEQQREDAAAALQRTPVPLDDVLGPDEAFPGDGVGRPVTLAGSYVAGEQIYVRGYADSGQRYAVATPLVTDTGSAVLVVRGATDRRGDRPAPGRVQVTGVLEPSTSTGAALDRQRVTNGVRVPALVESFGRDLYGGYVVLRSSTPAEELPAVTPPTPDPSAWAGIRNLMYAVQWWVFAAFVVFMWWRMVRDTAAIDSVVVPDRSDDSSREAMR